MARARDVSTGLAWSSPHNGRIAAALLDLLASDGDGAARRRALQAVGAAEETLREPRGWITECSLRGMFNAARADRALGRRVGEALVTPTALGLALRVRGIASVAKAYRRVDLLAPRESEDARYEALEVGRGRARIAFAPVPGCAPEDAWCGMREGLLAQVPSLFGLPAAQVRERGCVRRGSPVCTFEVSWREGRVRGLCTGGALGGLGGVALAAALGAPAPAVVAVALALAALGAAAGRSVDLAEALCAQELLRRASHGVLAQTERALAERIDALAKLDRVLAEARVGGGTGRAFASRAGRESARDEGEDRAAHDPAALVERAVGRAREALGAEPTVSLRLGGELPPVRCRPAALERTVEQLVVGAATAGEGATKVTVSLAATPRGVELSVETDGRGLGQEVLDGVFDPFAAGEDASESGRTSDGGGRDLAAVAWALQEEGGSLRVRSDPAGGTRFDALLGDGARQSD